MKRVTLLAWLMWGLTVAMAAACLALTRLNRLSLEEYFTSFVIASVGGSVAFSTVGALITDRQPGNRIGWLLSAAGVASSFTILLHEYTRYALVTRAGSVPGSEALAWISLWLWIPQSAIFLLYLPLLFPDGRLPSPRWRWALWCAGAASLLISFTTAISPGNINASLPGLSNPYVPAWSASARAWLNPIGAVLLLTALGAAVAAPLVRMIRSQGVERSQIRIFAFTSGVLALAFLAPMALYYPNYTRETLISGVMLSIGIPMMPLAVGVAVLRYRLYDIEVLIRRTLVYSLLSFLLVIGYLAAMVLLQLLIIALTGDSSGLAIAGSTLLMALLFHPLRQRIQGVIDRLFYREKYDFPQVLAHFSGAIRSEVDLERVAGMLVEQVEETMQPQSVSVWLVAHEEREHAE